MQQRTIGLLGGIGWASTALYYRLVNEKVAARLGPAHSARVVVMSLDQADFVSRASLPSPRRIGEFLVEHVARLESAGADFFLICANGAHRFAAEVVPRAALPFISIVEETARCVALSGIRKVGLLGVEQTMSGTFYPERLAALGIETVIPADEDRRRIHQIIYTELVQNHFSTDSREFLLDACRRLIMRGAEGIILGCTEIPLLLGQKDFDVPIFDTAEIHCEAAVAFAFASGEPARDRD